MWNLSGRHWRLAHLATGVAALALVATGCSAFGGGNSSQDRTDKLEPMSAKTSLVPDGRKIAAGAELASTAPRYDITASVDPATGKVEGTLTASLPVGSDAQRVRFRFFAGLPSFNAQPSIGPASIGGESRKVHREHSIVTVTLPSKHPKRVTLTLPFSYTIQPSSGPTSPLAALKGTMSPAEIGLLSRHDRAVNLGHWVPLWIPPGRSHDPKPDGFGDIGNLPPALFSLELSVPAGWQVITGGVRVDESTSGGRLTIHAEGYGLRSIVVSVVRGYVSEQRRVGNTRIRVYGPKSAREDMSAILDMTATSLRVLEDAFGPYPWRELDVVAAPLGAGIGGMEWSGAIWIESNIFAGKLPGLAGLGGESQDMLSGLLSGLMGDRIKSMRAWTIAHEVGHQWWHILVGNDSVRAPVVDEPLAQYSACLVFLHTRSGSAEEVCGPHIRISYSQARRFGAQDAPALQPSDEFASSMQYSGVIYGKAPYMYITLADKYGREALVDALRTVTERFAFELLEPKELRRTLATSLGDPEGVRKVWLHWFAETHGDADLGTSSGGLGGSLLQGLLGGSSNGGDGNSLLQQLLNNLGNSDGGGGQQGNQLLQQLLNNLGSQGNNERDQGNNLLQQLLSNLGNPEGGNAQGMNSFLQQLLNNLGNSNGGSGGSRQMDQLLQQLLRQLQKSG